MFEAVFFDPPPPRIPVPEVADSGPAGASACAAHARNAAHGHCGRCGVFICALCTFEVDRQALCPACFERLAAEGALEGLRTRYRDDSALALWLAVLGLFSWVFGLAVGPGAAHCSIRGLRQKQERGQVGGRAGNYVAIGLGVVELLAALVFVALLLR